MKKYFLIKFLAFAMLINQSCLFAYRYTFSNHTSHPLLIGIKLCCAFEELISKSVKPNKMVTFVHGKDFPNIKFGYCLQSISFVKNPTLKNKMKPEKAPWKEVSTTWIKTEAYDDILEFAQSLGDTTEVGGKAIVKLAIAAGAAETVLPGMLIANGVQKAKQASTDVSSTESIELPEVIESTKQIEVVEPIKQSVQVIKPTEKKSGTLGRFAKGLAKMVSITTCRDRHWDIYEDDEDRIIFTSKIQQ